MHGPTKRRNVSSEEGNEKKRLRTKAQPKEGQQRQAKAAGGVTSKRPTRGPESQRVEGDREESAAPSSEAVVEGRAVWQEKLDRLMDEMDKTYNSCQYSKCIKAANAMLKLPSYLLNEDWGTRWWGGSLERYGPGYRLLDGIRETLIVSHTESGQDKSAVKICNSVIADKRVPPATKAWAVTQKIDCLLNMGSISEAYTFAHKLDDGGVRNGNEVYMQLQKCFPWFVGLARIKWAFRELQDAAVNAKEALLLAGKNLKKEPASWVLWCYLIVAEAASELKPTKSNIRKALKWWRKAIETERKETRAVNSTATRASICRTRFIVWLTDMLEAFGNELGEDVAAYLLARLRSVHDELTEEYKALSEVALDDCTLELRAAKMLLCRMEGGVKEQNRTLVVDCSSGGVARYLTRSLTPNCIWVYQSPAGDPGMRLGLKGLVALRPLKAREELTVYRQPCTVTGASTTTTGRSRRGKKGGNGGAAESGDESAAPRLGFGEVYEDLTDSYGHAALLHGYLHDHGEKHRSPVFDTDAVEVVRMPPERVAREGPFRVMAARDVAPGERILMCDGIIRALSPAQLGQADPATVIVLQDLPRGAYGFWVNPKTMEYIAIQGGLPDLGGKIRNIRKPLATSDAVNPIDLEGLEDIKSIFGLNSRLTSLVLSRLRDPSHHLALAKFFAALQKLPKNAAFNRAAWKLFERYKLVETPRSRGDSLDCGESTGQGSVVEESIDGDEELIPDARSAESMARRAVFSEDKDYMGEALRILRSR
ncbi:hypothetical protein FOL47_001976 [Perkinsus chesapeaki]|uniref:Uncharacterized protein n=1 Tax=Perkinsus chesapeaki TaxID=330153 RepID=A0A7J6N1V6_PERCH|nr:hypothetical protein FOL47_001976 [Perkinsus chesapeaki]